MCVLSMVMDHYEPQFPPVWATTTWSVPPKELEELRALIKEFKVAIEAAATVDRLTDQPDCVDPEKDELVERVAELERRLNNI